jgi:hypothetical protein
VSTWPESVHRPESRRTPRRVAKIRLPLVIGREQLFQVDEGCRGRLLGRQWMNCHAVFLSVNTCRTMNRPG